MSPRQDWIPKSRTRLAWAALLFPFTGAAVLIGQFLGIPTGFAALIAAIGWAAIAWSYPLKRGAYIALSTTLLAAAGYLAQRPSNDREWKPEIARLPAFQIEGDLLRAHNLRDFQWNSSTDFDENWIESTFDLNGLQRVDAIVVPFGDSELAAHVMLSFGFADGRQLAVSVETRPEVGESYSLVGGASRQLELIYLFGTESDLLGLRILHRGDRLYSFPLRVDAAFARDLLLELCESANQLRDEPKFYATLRHNCTTTLLRHVNRLRDRKIGFSRDILFPAQLGALLHRLSYLDTQLDWPETKLRFRVDERIRAATDLTDFSQAMRSGHAEIPSPTE